MRYIDSQTVSVVHRDHLNGWIFYHIRHGYLLVSLICPNFTFLEKRSFLFTRSYGLEG